MRTLFRPRTPLSPAGGHSRFLFRLAQCVPFLIVLLGLGIELSPAHIVYTGPLLIAMPALASLTMGPKGTLAAAAGALIVSVTTTTLHQAWGGQQIYSNLLALFVVSAASVMTSNAVRTRRQSELDRIHRIAAAAQRVLLRPVSTRLGQVQVASMYLAAEVGAQIGGDLYEAVSTRYGVRMIVGDVRGKGLPAVRSAAAVLGAFREAVHYESDLVEVMNHCAAALHRDCAVPTALDQEEEADIGEDFVTALAAQVLHGSVIQVVNCGHPPPLVLRRGKIEALHPASPRPPLGLEDLMNSPTAGPDSYVFAPGDRLLLYTDGVVEARNIDNDFFPLPEALEAAPACTPPEFLEWLHQVLIRHTRGQLTDDVAVLVIDRFRDDTESKATENAITSGPRPSR
ncbi:serine phosphatase RsbU (regulator of sigma subunit) [Streptomyces sp. 2333.5]|uniref:PP2C family protein-serine/threonine phosphatase n=1 Tax=Streptomyces TaxID=1883 RepID=UPI00089CE954|nr:MULTISPECIES: PP2C family protein-serine/threonine phosphatase [unclassified Streptomyces]PJJ05891.1 serine phosphatase RsbU (regulator of sigma subunit) [Streptomyces sp. 2333.5]SEE86443.1 Serine phosphatase RsbU, regulator of sigma subunit [Streptomyces sp. 2314.4]SEF04962.1 Serine phosphatase RsbU, regulator of sigma subunit [Streptomyces sp. 2112.2]